jgi:putative acetyltransferase
MLITPGDFTNDKVKSLLSRHLEGMRQHSPVCGVHALDWSALQRPDISFYTLWDGDNLLGCGALKDLGDQTGEIKSMRTGDAHLRKGMGEKLLLHIIAEAKARGYTKLSLETGSGPAFDPALALYRKHGFRDGDAFADYMRSDFNQFLYLSLS